MTDGFEITDDAEAVDDPVAPENGERLAAPSRSDQLNCSREHRSSRRLTHRQRNVILLSYVIKYEIRRLLMVPTTIRNYDD
ncbi:hypothetical protein halTADL_2603 [Halohasta litchfieldiae]|nr:hypothetical protein halTADL_2603 [Halohasta litchfieldiae]